MRVELKSASTECGELSATRGLDIITILGAIMMQELCVVNWDIRNEVRQSPYDKLMG